MLKKLTFVLFATIFTTALLNAQIYDPDPYCNALPFGGGVFGTHLDSMQIEQLDGTVVFLHQPPITEHELDDNGISYTGYVYFNNIAPITLQRGETYIISFDINRQVSQTQSFWIDYDQSGTPFDASEGEDLDLIRDPPGDPTGTLTGIGTFEFTVPTDAECGTTRMRVAFTASALKINTMQPAAASLDPCFIFPGNVGGDVHDYDVFIQDPAFPLGHDCNVPVELASFTVSATLEGVQLDWRTESEIENLGFVLERRTEGTEFVEIASYKDNDDMLGQGTTSSANDYIYTDNLVEANNTYEYRLGDVDYNGVVTYHSTREVTVEQIPLAKVDEFTVLPAYPNPFNPSTTIRYNIPSSVILSGAKNPQVEISIYDITGKLISTLMDENQSQGWHSIVWNGTNQHGDQVPAGIYLSRITSGNNIKTSKLMLLK